ncbi:MAG: discoidin domain-containing protein [Kiritimatiellae bacterium]|nr:discoidin domain-containing protein [Kiritimatiellia bacterium]
MKHLLLCTLVVGQSALASVRNTVTSCYLGAMGYKYTGREEYLLHAKQLLDAILRVYGRRPEWNNLKQNLPFFAIPRFLSVWDGYAHKERPYPVFASGAGPLPHALFVKASGAKESRLEYWSPQRDQRMAVTDLSTRQALSDRIQEKRVQIYYPSTYNYEIRLPAGADRTIGLLPPFGVHYKVLRSNAERLVAYIPNGLMLNHIGAFGDYFFAVPAGTAEFRIETEAPQKMAVFDNADMELAGTPSSPIVLRPAAAQAGVWRIRTTGEERVRLRLKGVPPFLGYGTRESFFLPPTKGNSVMEAVPRIVSLGAKAKASSVAGGTRTELAFDGIVTEQWGNRWASAIGRDITPESPEWLEVELDGICTVTAFTIDSFPMDRNWVKTYEFQRWTGDRWETVHAGESGRPLLRHTLDKPVRGNRFRLLVTGATRFKVTDVHCVNISEFSIYGSE